MQVTARCLRFPADRLLRRGAAFWSGGAIAVFALLVFTTGVPRSPDLGAAEAPMQIGLLVVLSVAAIAAPRFPGAGGALLVTGGVMLGMFAALQYHPVIAFVAAAAFLAPGAAYLVVWCRSRSPQRILTTATVFAVVLLAGWAGAAAFHATYFGSTHPDSTVELAPSEIVEWIWSGGVTDSRAVVVARLHEEGPADLRVIAEDGTERTIPAVATGDRMIRFEIEGLRPGTEYTYSVQAGGVVDTARSGRFATMPDGAASFLIAAGSCARSGSNGAVYDTVAALDPLVFIQAGDAYYADIVVNDPAAFAAEFDRMLTSPAQQALFLESPVAYVWDDHDFGPNDSAADSPARPAAWESYRRHVPSYSLAGAGPIYQAFSAGRVRFILTDNRSMRSNSNVADGPAKTMLGAEQLAWLENELHRAAERYALVVWVNPVPWITPARPGADDWGGYSHERSLIADMIATAGIADRFVMVSGDAHMVAIDDGTHSDYSSDGGAGFPVLHAAALDRIGSFKGGPYSEGAFPGGGQFGTIAVADRGGIVAVTLTGRDWLGREIVAYTFEVAVPEAGDGSG
jgi:hypothetical protein